MIASRWLCAITVAAALALPDIAAAQEPGSRETRDFVQASAQSDAFEIREAETALAQSRNPALRAFATRMIEEHRQLADALREAAMREGLPPPPQGPSADQARLLGALQGMTGSDFDKAYARHQTLAHEAALVEHERYAASGDDPVVRQAATAATPLIAQHRAMAAQLAQAVSAE